MHQRELYCERTTIHTRGREIAVVLLGVSYSLERALCNHVTYLDGVHQPLCALP